MIDYKKIIKNRKLRRTILNVLSFVPDKQMIQLQYRIKTGRKLNLKNPKRYTEKLQWYKLYHRDPIMAKCVDKYEVRKYIESLGLGHILNECYGIYDKPEDIDFSKLPNQFVLKDTLGGGGNSIIICKDKSKSDIKTYINQMTEWVNTKPVRSGGREWVYYYKSCKHRIICEKYIEPESESGLTDFKYLCFNGKCKYIYVITNRILNEGAELGIYDLKYNLLPYYRADERKPKHLIEKPNNFDEMIKISELLSKRFPHVRVDLFNAHGSIVFGELTFFDGSGYMQYNPDSFDYELGKQFVLPEKKYIRDEE